MRRTLAVLASLLAGTASLRAQEAAPPPQVFLMTIGVGASIDARFGHSALWVHDSVKGLDAVYNYGTFDYHDPLFVPHFIQGRPLYWLSIWPLPATLYTYEQLQRSIEVQELNLPPAQRAELAFLLEQNALPANRGYRYDYYLDNCATRVRDILDRVLGGALRRATEGKPAAGDFRFHTQRSTTNNPFLYFGIMAVMGPSTDEPLDQWGEMFLPEKIQERVRELKVAGPDGTEVPLVASERTLVPMDVFHAEVTPPAWGWRALFAGMLLGLVMLSGRWAGARGKPGRIVTGAWLLLSGLGGLLLLYVWVATDHVAAANNRNLLLLSPLALALLPRLRRSARDPGQASRFFWFAMAGSLAVGTLFALVPSLGLQWNLQLAALVVPPGVAALAVVSQRGAHPAAHAA